MRPYRVCCGRPPSWRPALFLALLAALVLPARAEYVDDLVARAGALNLAADPEWRTLVHYRHGVAGWTSLIDDPRFFIAPAGRTHPAAELEATLRAFFAPAGTNASAHALCRFPARYDWLRRRLQIDESRLAARACEAFDRTIAALKPEAVALVYPAAFMNGPASAFGHTLLVVDGAGRNRLLSRAISYAARTDSRFGPLFTIAGVCGWYPGLYAYQPYYEKAQQYGDLGHRDVWEYELDLTPEEIDRLLRHAWELQDIYSRYFFFDENCAYQLLYLLDVARPSLHLAEHKPWFVIPIDTVRWVEARGLVRKVSYRPSPVTEIRCRAQRLEAPALKLALDLAHGRVAPAAATGAGPESAQRDALDLATDYLKYLHAEAQVATETYRPRLLGLLRARSALGKGDPLDVPVPARPDVGHGPMRWTVGAGVREGEPFGSLRWRLAYHAIDDPDDGFTPGAQIQFLNTEVRWAEDDGGLQRLDLVDVYSVAPRDALFQPSSWKVRFGAERDAVYRDRWQAGVNTGAGLAGAAMGADLAWAFVEAEAGWAEVYEHDYGVGIGPAVGWMRTVAGRWKNVLQARALYVGLGDDLWRWSASWTQDLRLSRDLSLTAEARADDVDGETRGEAMLGLRRYW